MDKRYIETGVSLVIPWLVFRNRPWYVKILVGVLVNEVWGFLQDPHRYIASLKALMPRPYHFTVEQLEDILADVDVQKLDFEKLQLMALDPDVKDRDIVNYIKGAGPVN